MKYEYGVAYETNGVKPELPEDVLVNVMFDGLWEDCGDEFNAVKNWDWARSQKFRIVDERWKPASDTNVGSNWHERGELPPVGEEVEVYIPTTDSWSKVKVLAVDCENVIWRNGSDGKSYIGTPLEYVRLPQSERDVLVEKASNDIGRLSNDDDTYIIERLIAKGWRPVKQQSEDEFTGYAKEIRFGILTTDEWLDLYRVGCRFVDVEG